MPACSSRCPHLLHHLGGDLFDLLLFQLVEDDDVIDAVEELGPEGLFQRFHQPVFQIVGFLDLFLAGGEAQGMAVLQLAGPHVGCHDDDWCF